MKVVLTIEKSIKNLLPWDVTDEHPITVLVFISWNIISAIEKIYELALIEEIFQSMGSTIAFNAKWDISDC